MPQRACRHVIVALIALALSVTSFPSYAQQVDWGQKSALLNLGMTEQEVVRTVGYGPNKVEMETCGQNTSAGAWSCKIYTFGNFYGSLTVTFAQDGSLWIVNNWSVSP